MGGRGLAIVGFAHAQLEVTGSNNVVSANRIGTDPDGVVAEPLPSHGVLLRSAGTAPIGNQIGTATERNLISGVRLGDGRLWQGEMVIIGIGIEPVVERLLAAGAAGERGVRVDEQCRTSLPDIYAVGDCALHRNRFAGGAMVRLESVQNAHDQASKAARAIVGRPEPSDAIPWFWSNQYDLRLQTVGLSVGYDLIVVRGRPEDRSFSVLYLLDGRVIALDCVNATRDYVQGRRLVIEQVEAEPAALADATRPLKDLGRSAGAEAAA
jgi:3-phenylpropionate/trans-cinnamate dioxygenase ferredoxin reductase subunit